MSNLGPMTALLAALPFLGACNRPDTTTAVPEPASPIVKPLPDSSYPARIAQAQPIQKEPWDGVPASEKKDLGTNAAPTKARPKSSLLGGTKMGGLLESSLRMEGLTQTYTDSPAEQKTVSSDLSLRKFTPLEEAAIGSTDTIPMVLDIVGVNDSSSPDPKRIATFTTILEKIHEQKPTTSSIRRDGDINIECHEFKAPKKLKSWLDHAVDRAFEDGTSYIALINDKKPEN